MVFWSVASCFFGRALLLLPSATRALFFRCRDAPVLRSVSSIQISTCSPQMESTKQLLSFCKVEHTMALQKVVFPSFWALHTPLSNHRPASCLFTYVLLRFRKWCFHFFGHCTLRLRSFCTVEHTMALQKVVFPICWALRASPSNHRPASCLFTYVFASCSARPCMPIEIRYEIHAAQDLGIRGKSCNQNKLTTNGSNLLCFTARFSEARHVWKQIWVWVLG